MSGYPDGKDRPSGGANGSMGKSLVRKDLWINRLAKHDSLIYCNGFLPNYFSFANSFSRELHAELQRLKGLVDWRILIFKNSMISMKINFERMVRRGRGSSLGRKEALAAKRLKNHKKGWFWIRASCFVRERRGAMPCFCVFCAFLRLVILAWSGRGVLRLAESAWSEVLGHEKRNERA